LLGATTLLLSFPHETFRESRTLATAASLGPLHSALAEVTLHQIPLLLELFLLILDPLPLLITRLLPMLDLLRLLMNRLLPLDLLLPLMNRRLPMLHYLLLVPRLLLLLMYLCGMVSARRRLAPKVGPVVVGLYSTC
jgi:hypothetical protein